MRNNVPENKEMTQLITTCTDPRHTADSSNSAE